MNELEFQETVLEGVKALRTDQKKTAESTQLLENRIDTMSQTLMSLQKARLGNIVRGSNPMNSLLDDPEKRNLLNAVVRRAVSAPLLPSHAKALGEDSSPGSTLINDGLLPELYDTLATYGAWATLAVRRVNTKITSLPVSTARAMAKWYLTESEPIDDDTNKAGAGLELKMAICAALINVSRQLIDDAELDVSADVLNDFVEAVNERIDYSAFQGDGTADESHGGFTGIFNGGTAAPAAAGNITVEDLDLEDFIRCLTSVDPVVLTRKAKWWIHPTILARICSVRDANGRPIFQTALEAPSPGAIGSILGYPVVLTMGAPSTNAAGAKVACFGDPNGCVVGVRTDFSFEASDHHKWSNYQRSFRAVARAGVKIRRATAFGVLTLPAS